MCDIVKCSDQTFESDVLEYSEWRNFTNSIEKAKTACIISGADSSEHFVGINRMAVIGTDTEHKIDDVMLSRYVSRLLAMYGVLRKETIDGRQMHFASKRKQGDRDNPLLRSVKSFQPVLSDFSIIL